MRRGLELSLLSVLVLSAMACEPKKGDQAATPPVVPPGQQNQLYPNGLNYPYGQNGYQNTNFNAVDITAGRIINRSLRITAGGFDENGTDDCYVDKNGYKKEISYRSRFAQGREDITLNFDPSGNLTVIVRSPRGEMQSQGVVPYQLNGADQSIQIAAFGVSGGPRPQFQSSETYWARCRQKIEDRRYPRNDRSYSRNDDRYSDGDHFSYELRAGNNTRGSYGNDNFSIGGNFENGYSYGGANGASGGFDPNFQPGQNPSSFVPNNGAFPQGMNMNYNVGNGGGGISVSFPNGLKGYIQVAAPMNRQHIVSVRFPEASYYPQSILDTRYGACQGNFTTNAHFIMN